MRTILAGLIMLSASTAVVHAAQAQRHAPIEPDYGYTQAQVSHRQPAQDDAKKIEEDNKQLDLPASRDSIAGADQVQSEESTLAKMIEQENVRLDRQLRGICRGC